MRLGSSLNAKPSHPRLTRDKLAAWKKRKTMPPQDAKEISPLCDLKRQFTKPGDPKTKDPAEVRIKTEWEEMLIEADRTQG